MKLNNGYFEEEFKVNFTQVGFHNELTNKAFLSFMEDIAGDHSTHFHMSFAELFEKNLTWVLLNWKLQILKRPIDNEELRVVTWGRFFNKLFVIRDFKVFNDKDELCAIASSKWCLVDVDSHKITRLPANIDELYGRFPDESVFGIEDLPKLNLPNESEKVKDTLIYKIRRFDLDLNKHVHNLNYLDYAYEVLPEDVYFGESEFKNVEISYKKEVSLNEEIKIELYESNNDKVKIKERTNVTFERFTETPVYTVLIKSKDTDELHAIIKLY